MQSRRTLTLTLSLLETERGTFGGTVSGSTNRDPRRVRSSSPLPARSGERIEERGASDCILTVSGQFKPFLFERHFFALKNGFVGCDGHHGGFVALLIARSRLQFDSGEIFFQGDLVIGIKAGAEVLHRRADF